MESQVNSEGGGTFVRLPEGMGEGGSDWRVVRREMRWGFEVAGQG